MLKIIEFPGFSDDSIFVQNIARYDYLEKTASERVLHPMIEARMAQIQRESDANKLYVLVNALGAGEYYGANSNGDYFEEKYLAASNPEWGPDTFTSGGVYRHHKNKEPEKSMGAVDLSVWNPRMRRVELILCLDRAKTTSLGHESVLTALDNDEHPSLSMGCRVKYDVCSICGNKAKTRANYCTHASSMMNQLMPDGRRVCVLNPFPRFFDISFVIIGADKISFAMSKLASAAPVVKLSADLAEEQGLVEPAAPTFSISKMSQMMKSVEMSAEKIVPGLESRGADLSDSALDSLSAYPIRQSLSALTAGGIVLRPNEYQGLLLRKSGRAKLANQLESTGSVFSASDNVDRSIALGTDVPESLAAIVAPLMNDRSCFQPFLPRRCLLPDTCGCKLSSESSSTNSALLETLSAGYNGYRVEILEKLGGILDLVTTVSPSIVNGIGNAQLEGAFSGNTKTSSMSSMAAPLVGMIPLAYLYRAYVEDKRGSGEKLSAIDTFIEKHPVFSASMAMGLARLGMALKESGAVDRVIDTGLRSIL